MAITFTRQSPTWADGHVVYAEDTERWEQLGADVATWSSTIDQTTQDRSVLTRRGMPSPCWTRTGLWCGTSGSWNELNRLSLAIITCSEAGRVIDRVRYNVSTAGSADAVVRFGFYDVDPDTWRPTGAPLLDTTGPANATGQHEVTLASTRGFNSGRPLAFAAVFQGTTQGQVAAQTSTIGAAGWYGTDANAATTDAYTGNATSPGLFTQTSVTGALPTLTPSTLDTYGRAPLIALRFA